MLLLKIVSIPEKWEITEWEGLQPLWGTPECLPVSYHPKAVSWGRVLFPACLPGVGR